MNDESMNFEFFSSGGSHLSHPVRLTAERMNADIMSRNLFRDWSLVFRPLFMMTGLLKSNDVINMRKYDMAYHTGVWI